MRQEAPPPVETSTAHPSAEQERGLTARNQRLIDLGSRWLLLLLGAWVLWQTRDTGRLPAWPWVAGGYALVALSSTAAWLSAGTSRQNSNFLHWLGYGYFIADALFVSALVWRDGGLGSSLYLVLALLALKAVVLAPTWPGMIWLPFAFGPLYAVALRLASGNFAFLSDPSFVSRYLLLWAWLLAMVFVAWELARRSAQAAALGTALVQQQAALAQKTEVLQRTATDLGDRVQELRSLQEVARALASTLRLDETLQVVVERLRGVTGSQHCAVALLDSEGLVPPWQGGYLDGALASEARGRAAGRAASQARPQPATIPASETPTPSPGAVRTFRLRLADEPATAEALRSDRVQRVGASGSAQTPLGLLMGGKDYVITPLVSRGRPIGALYLAEGSNTASPKTEQLVTSFAYFAATAIENARLYQDAWEKRRELEAVLAGIGDGVVVVDPELHLILMNPVAREILDVEEEPPAGVPLAPYLSAPPFVELLRETLVSQQELIRELDLPAAARPSAANETGRDGSPRTFGVLASPVLDADEQVSGVVAVLRDITAQKEIERMKSNFLSVVSHELRTPLHSIKGFVEIILMGKTGPVSELQEDFLRTVRGQTTVLQRMIDDLLEFSRMEAGRIKLHLSEVSLPSMAHAVASKLVPLADEGGLELYLDLPDDLPEIDGDRMRLEQVLTNLVENAIKFTPSGGQIHVAGERNDDHVLLSVSDTGIGIPPDEQEKIFDRFYQVDGSERRAYRGAGLGLSICRHIVERHQGRIWVESTGISGQGSRFCVELPIELRLAEAPTIDFTTPAA